jgi:hypothetical protein
LLLVSSFAVTAEEAQKPVQTQETLELTEDGYLATTVAGVQIFVDPETGRMRPPSEAEAAELAQAMQRMFVKPLKLGAIPAPVEHADGSISMVLDPSYVSLSVLHVDEDGNLHTDCVDDLHQALEVIEAHAPAVVETEKVEE